MPELELRNIHIKGGVKFPIQVECCIQMETGPEYYMLL